ncbi:basic secretory family protein [bacterium]|nr:basic secretory family protein [bacterium]MBU1074286.1 basic secretory family protein [bacterium]MBU1676606.1 basic secretory family protein [bacterium]
MKTRLAFMLAAALVMTAYGSAGAANDATRALDTQPPVRFFREPGVNPDVERDCLAALREHGPTLTALVWPFTLQRPRVDIHLMTTSGFKDSLGGVVADWGVGAAAGHTAWIDCERSRGVGRTVTHVMLHEISHCLLHQGMGAAAVPAWFHEGVAQHVSGEWRFRDTVSLMLEGHVPDLQGLEGRFPGNAQWADRAYRASLLAVDTLVDRYGEDVIGKLILATRLHGDFRRGFADATGTDYEAFTADFSRSMRIRFGWLVTLTRWPTLFVLLALGFALGAILRIRRTRRRLAELEDEDLPSDDDHSPTTAGGLDREH